MSCCYYYDKGGRGGDHSCLDELTSLLAEYADETLGACAGEAPHMLDTCAAVLTHVQITCTHDYKHKEDH